ncbi:hypothetical protein CEXT_498651 [Caerostris extrusa]|uniref:Uncharacterized protein n=1 Tax=Caerostris extrusa TaxID=172846 RepID=A0AAV4TMN3_CAEEX|nr:hypothetical protein CEXT_498651 [Caerostris extrusa]
MPVSLCNEDVVREEREREGIILETTLLLFPFALETGFIFKCQHPLMTVSDRHQPVAVNNLLQRVCRLICHWLSIRREDGNDTRWQIESSASKEEDIVSTGRFFVIEIGDRGSE